MTRAGGLFWAWLRCPACASSHADDPRSQLRLGGRVATNNETGEIMEGDEIRKMSGKRKINAGVGGDSSDGVGLLAA